MKLVIVVVSLAGKIAAAPAAAAESLRGNRLRRTRDSRICFSALFRSALAGTRVAFLEI